MGLKDIAKTERPTEFIGKIISGEIKEVETQRGPRTKWVQQIEMLSVDNRDENGRPTPRVNQVNVYTSSGRDAGKGSALEAQIDAYAELGFNIDNGNEAVGQTFKFNAKRIDRGPLPDGGRAYEFADIPVEHYPGGYTHPADKPRPIWQRKPYGETGAGVSVGNVPDQAPTQAPVVTQETVDAVLVEMYNGLKENEGPDLQSLLSRPETKSGKVVQEVMGGTAVTRLLDKGLLVKSDGTYQRP